jgi:hypothetical protein
MSSEVFGYGALAGSRRAVDGNDQASSTHSELLPVSPLSFRFLKGGFTPPGLGPDLNPGFPPDLNPGFPPNLPRDGGPPGLLPPNFDPAGRDVPNFAPPNFGFPKPGFADVEKPDGFGFQPR